MNELARKMHFGYSAGVPESVTEGWGARLILRNDGEVEMLPDRQGWFGDTDKVQKICDRLNSVKQTWRENVKRMYFDGTIRADQPNEVAVYQDDLIVMVGNTNGSHGYFYVAAWAK